MYTENPTDISEEGEHGLSKHSYIDPTWKIKDQRKKFRQKIFGEHYNYNYRRPNQQKMYRIQESRNTEIERENRILLQKIQGIFKRSLPKKRSYIPNAEEADNDHSFIRQNIMNARSRRSTETIKEVYPQLNSKNHIRERKRMQTEAVLEKKDKIHLEYDFRVTQKRNPQLDSLEIKNISRPLRHRVTLFRGTELIGNNPFELNIFVEGPTYTIIAKQQNADVKEKIEIPFEDYKKLSKAYLKGDHSAIVDYLHINIDTGLLELVGFEPKVMKIVQYGEVEVHPDETSNTPVSEIMPQSHERRRKTEEPTLRVNSQLQQSKAPAGQKNKLVSSQCELSSNLISLQIAPKEGEVGDGTFSKLSSNLNNPNSHTPSGPYEFDEDGVIEDENNY